MLSLPADVIPRIVSTPMCAQSLAATCKWMRGYVRSDIFIFVNEVVWDDVTTSVDAIKLYARSDYYTAISAPMNESGFMNAFSAGFTRESGPNLRVFGTILVRFGYVRSSRQYITAGPGTWESLAPTPPGYIKFTYLRQFKGLGSSHDERWLAISMANVYYKRDLAGMVIARGQAVNSSHVIFTDNGYNEVGAAIGQNCSVYARECNSGSKEPPPLPVEPQITICTLI